MRCVLPTTRPSGEDQRREKSGVEAKAVGETCVAPARCRLRPFLDSLNTWSLQPGPDAALLLTLRTFIHMLTSPIEPLSAERLESRLLDCSEIMCDEVVPFSSHSFFFCDKLQHGFNLHQKILHRN